MNIKNFKSENLFHFKLQQSNAESMIKLLEYLPRYNDLNESIEIDYIALEPISNYPASARLQIGIKELPELWRIIERFYPVVLALNTSAEEPFRADRSGMIVTEPDWKMIFPIRLIQRSNNTWYWQWYANNPVPGNDGLIDINIDTDHLFEFTELSQPITQDGREQTLIQIENFPVGAKLLPRGVGFPGQRIAFWPADIDLILDKGETIEVIEL